MSIVGAFPGLHDQLRRRTFRAPVNPLDKSTIVSIYPKEISDEKYTIQPGKFTIPSGSYENPSITIIGPSSWWREIDENQPLLEIPVASIQVADSIIRDYCNGLLGYGSETMPGLFYVPGEFTVNDVKKTHKGLLDKARLNQNKWYMLLVKMADALWARSNGNPLAISDDMRIAARELSLNNKEWIKDFQAVELVRCIACGSLRNPNFPVCAICKAVVDREAAEKLNLKFVS